MLYNYTYKRKSKGWMREGRNSVLLLELRKLLGKDLCASEAPETSPLTAVGIMSASSKGAYRIGLIVDNIAGVYSKEQMRPNENNTAPSKPYIKGCYRYLFGSLPVTYIDFKELLKSDPTWDYFYMQPKTTPTPLSR